MYIENAVFLELMETAAITALISNRAYYVKAPQDVAIPYVVIQSISIVPEQVIFASASPAHIARVQISIFDETYLSCKNIASAIKTVFNGWKGTLGTAGVAVGGMFLENEYDIPRDEDLSLYGVGVDYIIHY